MTRGIGAIVVAAVVTSPVGLVFAQNTASRVLVLDQQARTVTALEFPSGQAAQTAWLQGTPSDLLLTDDGKRLLVLDRGQGRDAGENGFQAKTRAAVTILDGPSLAVQDRPGQAEQQPRQERQRPAPHRLDGDARRAERC